MAARARSKSWLLSRWHLWDRWAVVDCADFHGLLCTGPLETPFKDVLSLPGSQEDVSSSSC